MTTADTREQVKDAEENVLSPEEQEKKDKASPASTDPVSETEAEDDKGKETTKIIFDTEGDFHIAIQDQVTKLAQGIKDTELAPLQAKVADLLKKNKDFEKTIKRGTFDADRSRREGKELETWGDTSEVREFQKDRRAFDKFQEEVQDAYDSFEDEREGIVEEGRQAKALMLAIEYGMEGGKELEDKLSSFTKQILDGTDKSGSGMELFALKASLQPKAKATKETKPKTKPDSSATTAPGGLDFSKMSASQKVTRSLEKQRNQGG